MIAVSYHFHVWKSGALCRLADGIGRERQACSCDQLRFILLARRPADEPYLLGKLGNRAPPPASNRSRPGAYGRPCVCPNEGVRQ
jgi:hypothetical protein